ncbi:unnamed protein product, partial [Ectocarpus sp. 12 AP-2014]
SCFSEPQTCQTLFGITTSFTSFKPVVTQDTFALSRAHRQTFPLHAVLPLPFLNMKIVCTGCSAVNVLERHTSLLEDHSNRCIQPTTSQLLLQDRLRTPSM